MCMFLFNKSFDYFLYDLFIMCLHHFIPHRGFLLNVFPLYSRRLLRDIFNYSGKPRRSRLEKEKTKKKVFVHTETGNTDDPVHMRKRQIKIMQYEDLNC